MTPIDVKKIKRGNTFQYRDASQLNVCVVLHRTKSKLIFINLGQPHDESGELRIRMFGDIDKKRLPLFESPSAEIPESIKTILALKKGDLVSTVEGEPIIGYYGGVSLNGHTVEDRDGSWSVPFKTPLSKQESLSKGNALDDWTATMSHVGEYHSGGGCQQYTISHKGKKVLVTTEHAWGGGYEDKVIASIGDEDPIKKLYADLKTLMEAESIYSEKSYEIYCEVAIIAQYLVAKEIKSAKQAFAR